MQVVDEVRGEELADGRRSPTDANVAVTGGLTGDLETLRGTGIDEVEGGAALHLYRVPGMVSEHEDGGVKRRLGAPPTFPFFTARLAAPWSALRPELVASHDFGADARRPLAGQGVVDAGNPTRLAVHCAEGSRREEPLEQPSAGVPERRIRA